MLVSDVVSCLVTNAIEEGSVEGIRIKRSWPTLHHILFVDDSILFCKGDNTKQGELKHIIDCYCLGSEKVVNMEKLNLFFSANTKRTRRVVELTIGINEVENLGKYLGLPTILGQLKREALSYLKDRACRYYKDDAISNWTMGWWGGEVLIKSVIASILTYTMSTFLLPKTWYSKINAIMMNFWWGQNEGEMKIYWRKWDVATRPKHKGALDSKRCKHLTYRSVF